MYCGLLHLDEMPRALDDGEPGLGQRLGVSLAALESVVNMMR
jgi:hypothetical protein